MPFTKVQIISRALTTLGKKTISTIASGGNVAEILEQGFDFLYEKEIGETAWRFCVKYEQLSRLALITVPNEIPYNNVYQLPGDLLALWRLWPRTLNFQIYGDKLYANVGGDQAFYIEYRYLPVVTTLPSYFANYLAYRLAADYANPITNNDKYIKIAELKAEKEKAIALAVDSQQHPLDGIQSYPYIEVRGGGARRWSR